MRCTISYIEPHSKTGRTTSFMSMAEDEVVESSIEEVIRKDGDTQQADIVLSFLARHGDVPEMSSGEERRLRQKIDLSLLPLLFLCCWVQELDRALLNYANIMGVRSDTSISASQFNIVILIFFVGYITSELPHGYALQRWPTSKYLGIMLFGTGVAVAATSACKNFGGLVATRIFLSCFESAVLPALILLTGMWYTRDEQPLRIGVWATGSGLGTLTSALISFAFQHYGCSSLKSWQLMFLLAGLFTCLVAGLVLVFLPDSPMKTRSFSNKERAWVLRRVRDNRTGMENKQYRLEQAIECFVDTQTWLLSLIAILGTIPSGAVTTYQAAIIVAFGFDSKTAALLQIPSGVVAIVSNLAAGYIATRYSQRGLSIVAMLMLGMIGAVLMVFLGEQAQVGKLTGNYLTNCIRGSLAVLYSWASANYAGHTKRVTINAILIMSLCIGSIIGPLTFTPGSSPQYIPAKIVVFVSCAGAALLALLLRMYYALENAKRKRAHSVTEDGPCYDFQDITDRRDSYFRYAL